MRELRADIASGRLPVGSRLPSERELATEFGVSAPTIREAISVLDAIGLVEVRHGSGTYVSGNVTDFLSLGLHTMLQMEQVGILEALEVRDLLGTRSARKAAKFATDSDIEAVAAAVAACDSADTIQDMAEALVAFQYRLSAASHNPLLFTLEAFLIKLIMKIQLMTESDRGIDFWRSQTEHFSGRRHELHRLLTERDENGLEAAMRRYLADQRDWFAHDSQVSSAKLSDPQVIRALDETFLGVADVSETLSS